MFVHLLSRTSHSPDCKDTPGFGLVCAGDCDRSRYLESLDAPFAKWEIQEAERLLERRRALMRGEIPA